METPILVNSRLENSNNSDSWRTKWKLIPLDKIFLINWSDLVTTKKNISGRDSSSPQTSPDCQTGAKSSTGCSKRSSNYDQLKSKAPILLSDPSLFKHDSDLVIQRREYLLQSKCNGFYPRFLKTPLLTIKLAQKNLQDRVSLEEKSSISICLAEM